MDVRIVVVYVWRCKAYVPTQGRIESGGPFVAIEPVFKADLTKEAIVSAIESALRLGHPVLPVPSTPEEWKKSQDVTFLGTGARKWSQLYARGANYTLEWSSQGIRLLITQPGTSSGWEFDPAKRQTFPLDTSLDEIVEAIMTDIASRPELKAKS